MSESQPTKLIQNRGGVVFGTAKAKQSQAAQSAAQQRQSKGIAVRGPALLIQDVCDTEEVLGRPEMDIDLFGCSCISMAKAGTYELDGDAFFVEGRAEIMPQGMRTEARNPGVPGKFCTEAVQTVS